MRYLKYIPLFIAVMVATTGWSASAPAQTAGVVNFATCISDSKYGKQEQASFESLKQQMTSVLENAEKQLTDISTKLNDPEFMDGLSPEGEEELKVRFHTLNEEMQRNQNQYYQVLNQANMRIIQGLNFKINQAAEKVAKDKKLKMIVNKEACFYCADDLDVTPFIITEMDKSFDEEAKKQQNTTDAA